MVKKCYTVRRGELVAKANSQCFTVKKYRNDLAINS